MEKLQKFLEQGYLNTHSPGYVIEMYRDGMDSEFIWGDKSLLPEKTPTSEETLYDIASLTKTFTAVLTFMAYEKDLLDLEQSVFSVNDKFTRLTEVTILDLLCHNQELYTEGYLGDAGNAQEFKEMLYSAYVLRKTPTYTDVNYIILSDLLEKVYKTPFDKLTQQKILNPLGLRNITFEPDPKRCASSNYESVGDTLITDLPLGVVHDKKARKARELGISTGHAGLFSTGKDLMGFLKSFLDCSLLEAKTIDLMLQHYDVNNYDFMGCRYHNDNPKINDVPECLSKESVTFSGYTGPMFVIDFEQRIIVVAMCNVLHNTRLDRVNRKDKTGEIIEFIAKNIGEIS